MPSTPNRALFFPPHCFCCHLHFKRMGWEDEEEEGVAEKDTVFLFLQNTSSSTNWHSACTFLRCRIRRQLFSHSYTPAFSSRLVLTGRYLWGVQTNQISRRSGSKLQDVAMMLRIIPFHKGSVIIICRHIRLHWKTLSLSSLSCSHGWQDEWKEDVVVYLYPTPTWQVNHPLVCCHTGAGRLRRIYCGE